MATTNVSDQKQNYSEKVQDLYCQLHKATVIHDQLTFIAVLNALLSITAFLGNVLVLVALRKESSLHPPSKLLFRSLAVTITDLCVGIIAEPLHVTFLVTVVNQNLNICRCVAVALSLTGRILTLESLLTLTAISVDKLIALLLVLQVITLNRTSLIIITFWVLLTVCHNNALLEFSYSLKVQNYGYIALSRNIDLLLYKDFPHPPSSSKSTTRPWRTTQPNKSTERFRKAVSTALWLQFAFIICYLPRGISTHLFVNIEPSSSSILAHSYTVTLVSLHSSLNPILYC